MKKLQSIAFRALVTPVIALGAGAVLAGQSTDQNYDGDRQSTETDHGAMSTTKQDDRGIQQTSESESQRKADHMATRSEARKEHRGYVDAAPRNGMRASNLIGTEVKTDNDEQVGTVDDLIIDEDGQVVAIVVGVGGFLGISEKDVAIGWDDVTRSGTSDDQELRIQVTREDLNSAPDFESQD